MIDKMDLHPKKCNIFGTRFLISDNAVSKKKLALEQAKLALESDGQYVRIELSDREKRIVEKLTPTPITNRTTTPITNRTDNPIDNRVPTPFGTHVK